MPISYMGSKNKSCIHIANIIEAHCPNNSKVLVELFTGGFAVGETFFKRGYEVIANDKNRYVIALLQKVVNELLDEKRCLEWVSREKFKDIITNPDKYEPWYVGYVSIIWSFGNNCKEYLFGLDIEIRKKSLYELVVNKIADEFVNKNFPQKYIDGIIRQKDWHTRRMALKKAMNALGDRVDLESLQSLQSLESLDGKVTFISGSYEEVRIPEGAIVYCDPPYKGTAEYAEGGFDHTKFWDYIRKLSKTHKVFTSEYNAPEDFRIIYQFSQKSILAGGSQSHNNQPTEKLFVYNPNK